MPSQLSKLLRQIHLFLLLFFLLPNQAIAKTVDMNVDWVASQKPDAIVDPVNKLIDSLEEGDTFRVVDDNKVVLKEFKLGKVLGAGQMGRVFYLPNTTPPQVLKLAKGGAIARTYFTGEIAAMEALERKGIPNSRMLEHDKATYIVKEFVEGKTLLEVADNWSKLSYQKKTHYAAALGDLITGLKKAHGNFSDLHALNIMFDEKLLTWKVIDPGLFNAKGQPFVERLYDYIKTKSPEFYREAVTAEYKIMYNSCHVLRLGL